MNQQFEAALQFDRTLAVGQRAYVRWTSCGNAYAALGEVAKVNPKSVRVKLFAAIYEPHYNLPAVPGERGTWTNGKLLYEAGQEIIVPRCVFGAMERWSVNNGVFPETWVSR